MKTKITLTIAFVALLIWIVLAFILDRYALASVFPWASKLATIKFQFICPVGSINLPRIGLVVLLGIPFLALAICCLPRRDLFNGEAWMGGFHLWCRAIIWLIVWILSIVAGQILYLALQKVLPDGLCKIAESFEIQGAIKVGEFDFANLKGSFTALLGLLAGAYFFLTKGVRDTLGMVFVKTDSDK